MGEKVIYSGFANFMIGREAVGGRLYLYEDKVRFKPHFFNFTHKKIDIYLNEIINVESFIYYLIIPTGLEIDTRSYDYQFAVFCRKTWVEMIKKQIRRYEDAVTARNDQRLNRYDPVQPSVEGSSRRRVVNSADIAAEHNSTSDNNSSSNQGSGRRLEL